jgi:hypothetical protein
MNEKLAMNAAANATDSDGNPDIHSADDRSVAAKIRLVELEALVGNLYLAKDVVSKPALGERAVYNTNQQ